MTQGIERRKLLKVTNVRPHTLTLHDDTKIGMWLTKDHVPRAQGYVSVGSRRYAEWLNLAYEATTDQFDPQVALEEGDERSLVETPRYEIPLHIWQSSNTPVSIMKVLHQPLPERKNCHGEKR